ncbi:MAG: glycosyl transferase group 1 family protein [Gemmatimonadetes bacterium]|nr:glycosyl transferase group 1 family protein [Gemmatimonadota bacterium]
MRRKRALVFLSTPLTPVNGVLSLSERAHVLTLRLLSERCEDVAVVARVRDKAVLAGAEHVSLAATGARLAFQVPDFGTTSRPLFSAAALLFSPKRMAAMRALAESADLLYAEVPSLEGLLVWRIARRLRKPYVIEMRGEGVLNPDYLRARIGWSGVFASKIIAHAFELTRRRAVGAIFVGEELRRRYAPPNAVTAVVSSVRLPPASPRAPRRYSEPASAFLFVGHLEKIKAVHVILASLAQIATHLPPDWRLDVIGDGPERAALDSQANELGIGVHVHFHGRVPWGEQLFRFYEDADLLVMASLTEGNSRTLIEGMAFALPAVSTAVGEASRHLCADVLVSPGRTTPFAETVLRLASTPERLTAMSAHNAAQVAEYAPEVLSLRRARFLDTVLNSANLGRRMNVSDT